ncbi:hypothetical protein GOP47_0029864 [Adiantum capillus-veneris]|nr:hypothetical protein GOP47_0029864 [Adiantum capillus-veneris]
MLGERLSDAERGFDFAEASSFALLVCGCLSLLWAIRSWVRGSAGKFPPGPLPLPILGHVHHVMNVPHRDFAKLSSKYGDIVGLRFGRQKCVLVSSPDMAKEILVTQDKEFANRPAYGFIKFLLFGKENDLFFASHGEEWQKRRKLCIMELFTAKRMQDMEYVRREEVAALLRNITHLSQAGTTAVDLGKCVGAMSTKIISRILYSLDGAGGGKDLPQIVKDAEQEVSPFVGDFFPWLSLLDYFKKRRLTSFRNHMDALVTRIFNERKQAMSMENAAPKDDLLHALLTRHIEGTLTMDEVKSILMGIFGGSIHSTTLTLEWGMAELLKNPHCLLKLQREIDNVIGKKEQILDSDLPSLKYLNCVVKEVLRLHPPVPLLLPHVSSNECKVLNYTLPANTHVFVNAWAIGRDARFWQDATRFMPERFEEKDMDVKGQHFEFIPFGTGRRRCLGLPLGLRMLELILANLVNKFNWELPCGVTCETINMKEKAGASSNKAVPTIAVPKLRV